MGLVRRIAEDLSDNPTPEDEAEIRAHLKNTVILLGGIAIISTDYALARGANSWQAYVLATPIAVAGVITASVGERRILNYMKNEQSEELPEDLSS